MRNGKHPREALWQDCETDEERADLIFCGRACELGLLDQSIRAEVYMAFHFRSEIMKDRMGGKG